MSDSVNAIAFVALAIASVGGALGMLSSRNIVHAAFWLLEVSVAAAGLYYILGAEYVALVQILVYAGAVAILLIFSIMLTLRNREDAERDPDFSWGALALAAVFFAAIAVTTIAFKPSPAEMPAAMPDLSTLGAAMFSPGGWALPFEIASLVLTAALIAAVWWSREEDE
jgi:NADH-quinone oxidoreductase subunit J